MISYKINDLKHVIRFNGSHGLYDHIGNIELNRINEFNTNLEKFGNSNVF